MTKYIFWGLIYWTIEKISSRKFQLHILTCSACSIWIWMNEEIPTIAAYFPSKFVQWTVCFVIVFFTIILEKVYCLLVNPMEMITEQSRKNFSLRVRIASTILTDFNKIFYYYYFYIFFKFSLVFYFFFNFNKYMAFLMNSCGSADCRVKIKIASVLSNNEQFIVFFHPSWKNVLNWCG